MHTLAQGHDPGEAKKATRAKANATAVNTVEYVCENFLAREGPKLRTRDHRQQLLRRLVYPRIGSKPINALSRSEINHMLDRIEDTSGARSADMALQYLRRAANWHSVRDDNFRSPFVRGMNRYDTAANARSRVLNDDEIRLIWNTKAGGAFAALVQFLLLTAARRSEAAGLQWYEIDDAGIWTLPAARNKNKTELARPLSKKALAVVNAQPRLGPFVFTVSGRRPISFGRCKREFTKRCGVSDWRLHDLRRTARTLLSRAGVSVDIAERALGHTIGGVRGIYDRHRYESEMRHAFEALAAQIDRIINPRAGVVTPLQGRR